MGNNKRNNNRRDAKDVKPLNDLELIRLGLRNEPLVIDQTVFIKSPEEKRKLKALKKAHKKYENSLID